MEPEHPFLPFGHKNGMTAGQEISPETLSSIHKALSESGFWSEATSNVPLANDHNSTANDHLYQNPTTGFGDINLSNNISSQSVDTWKHEPSSWHHHRSHLRQTQGIVDTSNIVEDNSQAFDTRPASPWLSYQMQGNTGCEKVHINSLNKSRGTKRAYEKEPKRQPNITKWEQSRVSARKDPQIKDPIVLAICALWLARFRGRRPNGNTLRGLVIGLNQRFDTLDGWFSQNTSEVFSSPQLDVTNDYNGYEIGEPLCMLFLLQSSGTMPLDNTVLTLATCFDLDFELLRDYFEKVIARRSEEDSGYNTRTTSRKGYGSESPSFHCKCCGKAGKKTADLDDTSSKLLKKPYACSYRCEKFYSNKSSWLRHEKTHQERWRCRYGDCSLPLHKGSVFNRRARLHNHIKKKHHDVDASKLNLLDCRETLDSKSQSHCHFQECNVWFADITERNEHYFATHVASSSCTDEISDIVEASDESGSDKKSERSERSTYSSDSSDGDNDPHNPDNGAGSMDPGSQGGDPFEFFDQESRGSGSTSQTQQGHYSNYTPQQFALVCLHLSAPTVTEFIRRLFTLPDYPHKAPENWLLLFRLLFMGQFLEGTIGQPRMRAITNGMRSTDRHRESRTLRSLDNRMQAGALHAKSWETPSSTLRGWTLTPSIKFTQGLPLPLTLPQVIQEWRLVLAYGKVASDAPSQTTNLKSEDGPGMNTLANIQRNFSISLRHDSMAVLSNQVNRFSHAVLDVERSSAARDTFSAEDGSQHGYATTKEKQKPNAKSPSSKYSANLPNTSKLANVDDFGWLSESMFVPQLDFSGASEEGLASDWAFTDADYQEIIPDPLSDDDNEPGQSGFDSIPPLRSFNAATSSYLWGPNYPSLFNKSMVLPHRRTIELPSM